MVDLDCPVRHIPAWLVLAAWAIGGTAIWTMHFMAMLGFSVAGTAIRYDVPITVASAVLAIVTVGVGMGRPSSLKILAGGLFTGLGVAAMHYVGMGAMRLNGDVGYEHGRAIGSVVIAVVAATVALWLAVTVKGPLAIVGSALTRARFSSFPPPAHVFVDLGQIVVIGDQLTTICLDRRGRGAGGWGRGRRWESGGGG
ncbi:MHYT domain-containing protein [Micromonospora sp. NPDC050397]|uniref:MHYT domain-containing protein n=1 Tax=Micromonospora sp. NPDC050397 TaxID=3364279 RepID=UPI00385100C0